MATITSEVVGIAKKAMYQLRQDIGIPNSTWEADTDTSLEWEKFKACYDTAFNEVLTAHNWTWKRGATAVSGATTIPDNWPVDAKNALVYCLARELAVPIAGRAEDMKNCHQLYQQKLMTARINDLEGELLCNEDSLLAELVGNFKADDAGLVHALTVYQARIDAVRSECEREVRQCFDDWATDTNAVTVNETDGSVSFNSATVSGEILTLTYANEKYWKPPYDALVRSKMAAAMGFDAGVVQIYQQEYATKLAHAVKDALDRKLATNSDAVLTQLLGNFKADDTLVNTYTVYTQRSTSVKALAEQEINREQEWQTAFDYDAETATSHVAYPAWVALCVSKLAMACGMDANGAALMEQKYKSELQAAKLTDLENARMAVTDEDVKEVVSLVLANTGDSRLPRSLKQVSDRIAANKAHAMAEVMEAHNWSFARDEYMAGGGTCSPVPNETHPWSTPVPPKCARVLTCKGQTGREVDWKIDGTTIRSDEPVLMIVYLRDVGSLDRWPSMVRSAYVALLAADVASMVTGSAAEAQQLRQIYDKRLEDAKLVDSKASGMRREQRGGNFYAERMMGGGRAPLASDGRLDVLRRW